MCGWDVHNESRCKWVTSSRYVEQFQAQIQDFCQRGARKNAENQGHSSIELEMYKLYIDKLHAKRAYNFEARNVQNCMKLWCTWSVLQIKQYLRYKCRNSKWINCAQSAPQILKLGISVSDDEVSDGLGLGLGWWGRDSITARQGFLCHRKGSGVPNVTCWSIVAHTSNKVQFNKVCYQFENR